MFSNSAQGVTTLHGVSLECETIHFEKIVPAVNKQFSAVSGIKGTKNVKRFI